jgi:ribonuclease HI
MNAHRIEEERTDWFCNYLNSRFCRIKGDKRYYRLVKGTGQGRVLLPTVWNFVMDSFLDTFATQEVDAIRYADNGALIIVATDLEIAQIKMHDALHNAQAWGLDKIGLQFSIAKTKAMVFSRKRDPPTLIEPLLMSNTEINVVTHFKYLGVTLDSKLCWTKHVKDKIAKAKKHWMLLHKGLGTTWGPTPAITLWLYTGIVRPALKYGAAIWVLTAAKIGFTKRLKKVQRLGMVLVAPMRCNTPISGLKLILGIPPLHLYIQTLATSTYIGLNLTPKGWKGQVGKKRLGHIKWLESITESLPHRSLQDRCVTHNWQLFLYTYIGDGEDAPHDDGLCCYIDGSERESASGSGLAAYRGNDPELIHTSCEYTGAATVFQSELHAINMSCTFAIRQQNRLIIILSNSQSAIQAIANPLVTSRTVLTTINAKNALGKQGKEVCVQWVRGHNDTDGNDLADHMANLGAAMDISGPEPFLPFSHAHAKRAEKEALLETWAVFWIASRECVCVNVYSGEDGAIQKLLSGHLSLFRSIKLN